MKKYYRRLTLLLSLLMAVITLGVMGYLTVTEVNDINERMDQKVKSGVDFSYYPMLSLNTTIKYDFTNMVESEVVEYSKRSYYAQASLDSVDDTEIGKYCAIVDGDGKIIDIPRDFLKTYQASTIAESLDDWMKYPGSDSDYVMLEFDDATGNHIIRRVLTGVGEDSTVISSDLFSFVTIYAPIPESVLEVMDTEQLSSSGRGNGEDMMLNYLPICLYGVVKDSLLYVEKIGVLRQEDGVYCEYDAIPSEGSLRIPEGGQRVICIDRAMMSCVSYGQGNNPEYTRLYESWYDSMQGKGDNRSIIVVTSFSRFPSRYSSGMTQKEKAKQDQEAKDALLTHVKNVPLDLIRPETEHPGLIAEPGFFTSYWFRRTGITSQTSGRVPDFVTSYVVHPFASAVHKFRFVFLAIAAVWGAIVSVIILLVRSLRRRQEYYEKSRLSMTRAVAHELKTPLAVTKNYIENWSDLDEEQRTLSQQDMSSQIDYVNSLVGDMLDLSRFEAKAKKMNPEPVNLAELNEFVMKKLEAISEGKEFTVNLPSDPEVLTVQADLSMMRTVLTNLLTNAIRYGDKKISIDISKKKDTVRYQVTNDGAPIPADKLPLVWDSFYCADESRAKTPDDRTGKRTGLGLAITKQILELHKAKYGCESGEDGTTFWFDI